MGTAATSSGTGCIERFTPTCVGTAPSQRGRPGVGGFTPTCVGTATRPPGLLVDIVRFTPTCVGTASSNGCWSGWGSRGSPPHAWGQRQKHSPGAPPPGSPPHAWGQRRRMQHCACGWVHPHMRGDSLPSWAVGMVPVHPHMRGDSRARTSAAKTGHPGSPPHAWGQLVAITLTDGSGRQGSPPHAWGQPGLGRHTWMVRVHAVHPHMRGDSHLDAGQPLAGRVHPHMRGDSGLPWLVLGLTLRVHPHMRGDSPIPPITIIVKRPFLAVYGGNSRQCPVIRDTPGGAQWISAHIRKPCLDRCLWRWRDETRQNR